MILIPPQPEPLWPFLVSGAVVGRKYLGNHFSLVRRRGDETVDDPAAVAHGLMVAGRAALSAAPRQPQPSGDDDLVTAPTARTASRTLPRRSPWPASRPRLPSWVTDWVTTDSQQLHERASTCVNPSVSTPIAGLSGNLGAGGGDPLEVRVLSPADGLGGSSPLARTHTTPPASCRHGWSTDHAPGGRTPIARRAGADALMADDGNGFEPVDSRRGPPRRACTTVILNHRGRAPVFRIFDRPAVAAAMLCLSG